MDVNKVKANLEKLRKQIARKPTEYTNEYAKTISESFVKYTNTSSVNMVLSSNEILKSYGWAFPIYVTRESMPIYIKPILSQFLLIITIKTWGFRFVKHLIRNKFSAKPKNFDRPDFKQLIDQLMLTFFYFYKKRVFLSWINNPIFTGKEHIIKQVKKSYEKGLWTASISTAFPLLDHLMRTYYNTDRFDKDINQLLSTLRKAGITSEDLKPGYIAQDRAKDKGDSQWGTAVDTDLRLVGVALGSFVDFASVYYKYFRRDTDRTISDESELNRHAVLHGASIYTNTKLHATKLLIFIDLAMELEPALKILLKED